MEFTPFETALKYHLDKRAAEDPQFAVSYAKPNKSLEECCKYIYQIAEQSNKKKQRVLGAKGEEVIGLAIHYYDEDDIKVKGPDGKVVGYGAAATPNNADATSSAENTATKPKTRKPRKPKVAVDPNIPEPLDIPIF